MKDFPAPCPRSGCLTAPANAARRRWFRLATLPLLWGAASVRAQLSAPGSAKAASDHPIDYRGPITIVVGFPAGGATDSIARLLAPPLQRALGQPVRIENRPGDGGVEAARALRDAPPDGATVMLSIDHTHVISQLMGPTVSFDPLNDFTPLAGVASYFNALAVGRAVKVESLGALGDWLRDNPGQARIGVPVLHSVPHLAAWLLGRSLGVSLEVVPYGGGGPLIDALMNGQVALGVAALSEFLPHHRSRRLRVLGVTGLKRAGSATEIPTFREQGLFDLDVNPWLALFGPPNLPPAFASRFTKAVATTLATPEIRDHLYATGVPPSFAPPGQLQHWIRTSNDHWRAVIQQSGITRR